MALVGIDFGTAHTRAVLGPLEAGITPREVVVPSAVVLRPDGLLLGDAALAAADDGVGPAVHGLKRLLGRTADDEVARAVAAGSQLTLVPTAAGLVARPRDALELSVEEAVARLLAHVAGLAAGDDRPVRAVIAAAGWYGLRQEAALAAAAERAGLEVLRFIEEAAAMALALRFEGPGERTVAIVNAGAGSLSVSFASIESRSVFLLASGSDRHVGGDDVTRSLVARLLPPEDLAEPPAAERCRQAVERMKQQLTVADAARDEIELVDGRHCPLQLHAAQLEEALGVLRAPLAELYAEGLEEAALEPGEVDVVYGCGGMSTLAGVSDLIFELTGRVPRCGPSLQSLVARGAAIQASILEGRVDGPLVFDGKSSHSSRAPDSNDDAR